MSHAITAIQFIDGTPCGLARLDISAANSLAQTLFYESLDAQDYNNLCSGNGESATYTRAQLLTARTKLHYLNTENVLQWAKPGRNPLYDILAALTGADVLDNGEILDKPEPHRRTGRTADDVLIIGPTDPDQHAMFCEVLAFYDVILRDGTDIITIQFR